MSGERHEARQMLADEIVGQTVELLMPERFRARHISHQQQYAESVRLRPIGVGLEFFGRRKEGTEFPVEINSCRAAHAHADTAGGPTAASAALRIRTSTYLPHGQYHFCCSSRCGTLPAMSRKPATLRGEIAMTMRRITAQMLYARSSPVRWIGALLRAMEEATASLCRLSWQHGYVRALQPVVLASSPRRPTRPA